MAKIKKRCGLCVFAKIQMNDANDDLDFDKKLFCIKDGYKQSGKHQIMIEWQMPALGKEVENDGYCDFFLLSKLMKEDIVTGCIE